MKKAQVLMETIKYTFAADSSQVPVLLKTNRFKDELKEFNIKDYTNELEALGVVFQCFPENDSSRKVEEYKVMRRKTKTLELYLILDYDKIKHSSDEENLCQLKSVFRKGCETYLKPMNDFDWEKFEKEVLNKIE